MDELYTHWSHFNFKQEQWREAAERFLELSKRLAELNEFDDHIDHDGLADAFVTCHLCAEIREMEGDHEAFAEAFAPIWAEKAIELAKHRCQLPRGIQEALNSGDGVYRP